MLALVTLLFSSAQAGVPLTIEVEPDVEKVTLTCGAKTMEARVQGGKATFASAPPECEVRITKKVGLTHGTGIFQCTDRGCQQEIPPHRPISDADGRVNFVVVGDTPVRTLELTCPSGLRARSSVTDFAATFDGVPGEKCTVYVKGTTAKFHPVEVGTYACTVAGPTFVCNAYTPK